MKRLAVVFILAALPVVAAPSSASRAAKTPHAKQAANPPDAARWEQHSRNVTIMRDDWGIAHVYGKTDADAVFGMIYAQAEDDFNRVETNYINAMGCLAEAEGESKIYRDLRMKLFIDPEAIKKDYAASPEWLKKLMNAWADGLNYYLAKHPEVQPRVIRRFDPWMALTFTEGSIGGDIERVNLSQLEAFYGKVHVTQNAPAFDEDIEEPGGSNGMAIAPSNTVDHHALLLINPHTSFFFRSELQMASEDGLDAYGAVTWGQFFVYQGFNDRAGWMHTSSGASQLSFYLETVDKKGDRFDYNYGNQELLFPTGKITVPYKTDKGMAGKKVHRVPHAAWAGRRRDRGQVADHPSDERAGQGADTIVFAHEGERLPNVSREDGAPYEFVQQHRLRRCRRRDRLLPRQLHSPARSQLRLEQAGRRQQSGDGLARPPFCR